MKIQVIFSFFNAYCKQRIHRLLCLVAIVCISLGLLSSCYFSNLQDEWVLKGFSLKKQKQKIIVLQKKLKFAQKEEMQAKERVTSLSSEIEEAELELVRNAIDRMEYRLGSQEAAKRAKIDVSNLFLQERAILERLIEAGPSPVAIDAQGLLEKALQMITSLSDTEEE